MKGTKEMTKTDAPRAEAVSERGVIAPPVDVYENKDELLLIADMPGVAKGDVELHVENDQLRLYGKRPTSRAGAILGSELGDYDYERTFRLPEGLDTAHVKAEMKDGVLNVHLPKAAHAKPRRIAIQ